ncbi:DtxR family transcriptional regulator [Desulfoplanes formicivorans]|uniref:Transcriptional regulator MntR n=2 Tax=Desulfoplanes formicivorans TaxID=1592317 RepID=A0A194AM37_9BACT|nr:DtxR family transcriptional regulator [Desulfoplanes formicivorans]
MVPAAKKDSDNRPLTPAMEDYLEAIYQIGQEKKIVRVKDIAVKMDVKMPTVTSMLKNLGGRGYINYEKYGYVDLTGEGISVGREICRKHGVLYHFLKDILNVDPKTADEEACKMEHTLCSSTLDRLVKFMEFIQACPRTGEGWLEYFEEFIRDGRTHAKCARCTEDFTLEFKERVESLRGQKEEPDNDSRDIQV